MDIRIQGFGAERIAADAVGKVFGDDISTGPRRACNQPLAEALEKWPAKKADEIVEINLQFPPLPGSAARYLTLRVHRVQILLDGKLAGHALRMSDYDLAKLASWEQDHNYAIRQGVG